MNNMDYKYIEQLLDRYFAAETTLQEEQILKTFYSQHDDDMPQSLRQYAPIFDALEPQESLDDAFDESILQLTEAEEVPVVKARTISLAQRLRPLFSAAAVVAFILTLTNAMNLQFKSETTSTEEIVVADIEQPSSDKPALAYDQDKDLLINGQADSIKVDTVRIKM